MRLFSKKPKAEKNELYKVFVTFEVLVYATNQVHAVNRVHKLREKLWAATREFVLDFSITEHSKAKKL